MCSHCVVTVWMQDAFWNWGLQIAVVSMWASLHHCHLKASQLCMHFFVELTLCKVLVALLIFVCLLMTCLFSLFQSDYGSFGVISCIVLSCPMKWHSFLTFRVFCSFVHYYYHCDICADWRTGGSEASEDWDDSGRRQLRTDAQRVWDAQNWVRTGNGSKWPER